MWNFTNLIILLWRTIAAVRNGILFHYMGSAAVPTISYLIGWKFMLFFSSVLGRISTMTSEMNFFQMFNYLRFDGITLVFNFAPYKIVQRCYFAASWRPIDITVKWPLNVYRSDWVMRCVTSCIFLLEPNIIQLIQPCKTGTKKKIS